MKKQSAGLLLYRIISGELEVLLVHPGGPYWMKKDDGAWSIPKGEPASEEELLTAAVREFREELGIDSVAPYLPLGHIQQKGGKVVHVWACAGDLDPAQICSNTFEMEWPPKSGKICSFPEVDRAAFFSVTAVKVKIIQAQFPFIERLQQFLK